MERECCLIVLFKHLDPAMPEVRPTPGCISDWSKAVPFSPKIYFDLSSVLALTLTRGLSFAFRIHKEQVKLPWRKTLYKSKTIKNISNFHYHATTSIHLVPLIHKVPCQVSWHPHGKQIIHRFLFFSFLFFLKLTLPLKTMSRLCSDTSSWDQLLSPAHVSRKHLPQRK